jgi:HlyD family secretion protein
LRGSKPQPVPIKTGISDGVMTEVVEGLKEGDRVVTAQLNGAGGANSQQQSGNPFAGPRRF